MFETTLLVLSIGLVSTFLYDYLLGRVLGDNEKESEKAKTQTR
ncbi:MAG TPA: hypothetical protein V6C78_28965 [Crinalium sp.]|jgi:hypothetical protein